VLAQCRHCLVKDIAIEGVEHDLFEEKMATLSKESLYSLIATVKTAFQAILIRPGRFFS
jgi:hypothetical protein